MLTLRIDPAADRDLADIDAYTQAQFGTRQAERYLRDMLHAFEQLQNYPYLGRVVEDRPNLHRYGYGSHVIIYTPTRCELIVRRVLHGHMDLLRHLNRET